MGDTVAMISIDSETTGLDLRHGAKPFMVQMCLENGELPYWEWEVNPKTRQPRVKRKDVKEILEIVKEEDELVLQNPKFDVAALATIKAIPEGGWPWKKTRCTLLAGHLLASNHPHSLTAMALLTLGVNVQPFEDAVKKAVKESVKWLKERGLHEQWRLAKKGLPEMPSAKDVIWKNDMWVVAAVAKLRELPEDDDAFDVVARYGCSDAETTRALYIQQRKELKERKLWRIYQERLKLLPVVYKMEERGVTVNKSRLLELSERYQVESDKTGRICKSIAEGLDYGLVLPKSGNNKSLLRFVFGWQEETGEVDEEGEPVVEVHKALGLEPVKVSKKTGIPSLDKSVLEHYDATLPRRGRGYTFVKALKAKRQRDTALQYLESYQRFWVPVPGVVNAKGEQIWYTLFPSLNSTGTDTLRFSSQNPNEQNISKKEGFNLRYCFGPLPGREWWSLDAKNIELRIPAYEAGETEQIELFEKPDDAPYFGSNHLLVFDTLHSKRLNLNTDDPEFLLKAKKKYASTWYQWTKNGNFAVQYGAIEKSGTADRAYHVEGAQRRIQGRFKKIHGAGGLNDQMIAQAEKFGCVETMPDKTVDPKRGYPLLCTRTHYGKILPTVPLNYHVQGTAMWWMSKAMVRSQEYLNMLNAMQNSCGYFMAMQVHDEIVFDFPYKPKQGNLPKIEKIGRLMARGGDDIGLPTPVSVEYHKDNWSEGL